MKLADLPSGNIFYFTEDDIPAPIYLRVDMGFVDVFWDAFQPLDGILAVREIIKVDRSLLWREGAQNDIPQYIIEARVREAMGKYKKQIAIDPVTGYFFVCTECRKKYRSSRDIEKARVGLCLKCRKIKESGTEQPKLLI